MRRTASLRLWRFGKVSGLWSVERVVTLDTAEAWLAKFRQDAPGDHFVVAARRPSKPPQGF